MSEFKAEVLEEIGRGGFCVVERVAITFASGRTLVAAFKRLQEPYLNDPEVVGRFQREARLLDDVLNHENIVEVLARNVSDAQPWFAMPVADTTLAAEIDESQPGDEEWVVSRYDGILQGMAYAHDKGVIHRDLKPENVLVYDDEIAISDFGLGKHLVGGTAGLTRTGVWSGTESYMAPEQFKSMKEVGPEADVFSLGKLLCEMLTGETPIVGQPTEFGAIPERFRYFIQRCCSAKPENRYPDAKAAQEAFRRVCTPQAVSDTPEERLDRLVEDWWNLEVGDDLVVTRQIDEHLRTYATEERMFTRKVPQLPDELLDQYMDELPEHFEHMLAVYDDHVSGGLPFEYCDVVTDFYERVFRRVDSIALRQMIMRRLIEMGASHNRFHVRTRLLSIWSECRDPSTIEMARDLLRASTILEVQFLAERSASFDLPQPIQHELQRSPA